MKANTRSFFFGLSWLHSKRMFSWLVVLLMVSSNLAWVQPAKAGVEYAMGDVLINEFVSNGVEWVELLNTTGSSINLTGWTLEHTYTPPMSPPVTANVALAGFTIPVNGIVVVTPPAMRDEGAILTLKDPTTATIFVVSYGDTTTPPATEPHVGAPGAGESAILGAGGTLSITGTPSKGWFNDAVAFDCVAGVITDPGLSLPPTLSSISSCLAVDPNYIDTNMGSLEDPSVATNLYFEKNISVDSPVGMITFAGPLNLTDQNTVDYLKSVGQQFDSASTSGNYAKVSLNTYDPLTGDPSDFTGEPATVVMYGLTELSGAPDLIVKDNDGSIIDPLDLDYPEITAPIFNDGADTFTFTTSHFTSFETEDVAPPEVSTAIASPDPAKDGTVTVTVVFNEEMDTAVSPTVQIQGISGSPIAVVEDSYSGATWTGTFALADNNEQTDLASIAISGAKDIAGNEMDPVIGGTYFTVDTVDPTASIDSPSDLSYVKGTVTIQVTADDVGGSGIEKVEFYYYSAGTFIGDDLDAPYSFNWDTTLASDGAHDLVVVAYDNAGNTFEPLGVGVTVDNNAPTNQDTVFATSPTVPGGSAVPVVSADEIGGSIWFAPLGTTTFTAGLTMTTADGTATTINAPTTPGTYKLFVIDAAGNVSVASADTLTTTDSTPPELVSADAVGVNKIEVNFDEDLDGPSLNVGDFKVTVGATEFTIELLSENNGRVTLYLGSNLQTYDTPDVTINPGVPLSIKDLLGNEQTAMVTVTAADKMSPIANPTLGDGISDYQLPFTPSGPRPGLYGASIDFSEELSSDGVTAVENALTAGTDKVLTFRWLGNRLRVSYEGVTDGSSVIAFANDVMANITDSLDNTGVALLVDSVLNSDQTEPDGSGDATLNNTTPDVVITDPVQPVTITVSSGTTSPTIDVSSLITDGTGVLPEITIDSANANNASVVIPAGTTVTSADPLWDGVIAAPTVTTVTLPVTSGETKTLSTAIEVGFTGAKLSFDQGVRILLPGQAGKRAGYVRTGIAFTEITAICSADTQAAGDALAVDGDCKIDVASDLAIWTKHFTSFASFSSSATGGGGDTGGGSTGGSGGGMTRAMLFAQTTKTATSPVVTTSEKTFSDIIGHWAKLYIEKLANLGVVKGKTETTFAPNDNITRAELTKMVMSAFKYSVAPTVTNSLFGDVPNTAWYAPYVVAARNAGVIVGYGDGTFKPEIAVNRAEALKILMEAAKMTGVGEGFKASFPDVLSTDWFAKYVAYAKESGIVGGYADGTFGPGNSITRAEVAKMIVKILELK